MTLEVAMRLERNLFDAADRWPENAAILDAGGEAVTYRELGRLAGDLGRHLTELGIGRGERVAVYLHKSADAVACIFGILSAGAAYVPVDPASPVGRNADLLADCAARVVIVEAAFAGALKAALEDLGHTPAYVVLDGVGGGAALRAALSGARPGARSPLAPSGDDHDLACILYTSGSTGEPKGVMLSHRNAGVFVGWCSELLRPTAADRFSSHAPFHFDLSLLDLFVSIRHGACLVLIPDWLGTEPTGLAELIARGRITVWYSVPSILALLARYGRLARFDYSSLRAVLFAGEVFPIPPLRLLRERWPRAPFYNLYGPTETNVCTYSEIPVVIPAARHQPFPIGKPCPHYRSMVVGEDLRSLEPGHVGELWVSGPGVMLGYWGRPEETAARCHLTSSGERWYRTGDLVVEDGNGDYHFLGRRDRMVKKLGYRVEPGAIESRLRAHPELREAAVVAVPDQQRGARIAAFLCTAAQPRPTALGLRDFCARHLPRYMIPDAFLFLEALPLTGTGKIDYRALAAKL